MVTVIVFIPLLLALAFTLAVVLHAIKMKSLSQSMCLQGAIRLQTDLKRPLKQLMRMNVQARTLRMQRTLADQNLATALASGVPYAIAAAKAVQTAVIAAQVAFRARQELVLIEARAIRLSDQQRMSVQARSLGATGFVSPTYYYRALAVEPRPRDSLSPDYVKIAGFGRAQQQRFRFRVNLLKHWPVKLPKLDINQTTECSVSLQGEEQKWNVDILAVKAALNSSS
jgi:hypothetical protein